jgi:general secretion pathway protein L
MDSIGLTVSDNHVAMVLLKKGLRGEPSLYNYRLVSLKEVNPEDREEIVLSNIEGFIDQTKSDRDNLFLGIPGTKVIFKSLSLPSPTEENLKEVLGFEMDRYTPFALEDVYFDFKIVKRDPARDLINVLLMVVKKDVVEFYLKLLQRVNITVRSIEVISTALYNTTVQGKKINTNGAGNTWGAKSSEWLKARPWGETFAAPLDRLLNTGQDTDTVTQGGTRFLVAVDDGGCELGIVQDDVFTYARSFTVYPPGRTQEAGGTAKNLADTILSEIETTRLSLGNGIEKQLKLIVSGNQADSNLVDLLKGKDGDSDVQLLETLNIPVLPNDAKEKIPCLSAAVGLALKGLNSVPLDVNFIPKELRPKKKKNWSLIFGSALIVLLLLGLFSYAISFFAKERFYLAELTERVNVLKGRVEKIEQMKDEIGAIEQTINAIEKVKEDEISKLELLKELTQIIPEEMWLTRFSYSEKKGVRSVDISGFADAASELIPILEESPLLENVKFKSSIVKDRSTDKEKFNVTATVSAKE